MVEPLMLDFGTLGSRVTDEDQGVIRSLSGAVAIGKALWTASDETSSIERLVWTGRGYGDACSFRLDDYFPLPDGTSEVDVEGLALDGDRLWIVGSHSQTRPDPYMDGDKPGLDRLREFADVSPRQRRRLLGFLTLSQDGMRITTRADRTAPCLPFKKGNLRSILDEDPFVGPFLSLADKENGLSVEGVAAAGDRVMLGLRGPVLRGQIALIVELCLKRGKHGLKAERIGTGGPRYRLHFLPLAGMGIRDLQALDVDLVILAGPTMRHTSPFATFLWDGAMIRSRDGLVDPERLTKGPIDPDGVEGNPEALSWLRLPDGREGWLVLHDAPGSSRYAHDGTYRADFIPSRLEPPQ